MVTHIHAVERNNFHCVNNNRFTAVSGFSLINFLARRKRKQITVTKRLQSPACSFNENLFPFQNKRSRHLRALKCFSPFLFIDDYNRVVLETIEGEPDSDYVNASYVDVSISRYSLISMRVLMLEKTN